TESLRSRNMSLRNLFRVALCSTIVWLLSAAHVVQADEFDGIRALEAKYRAALNAGRLKEAETYARATLQVVQRDFPSEDGMVAASTMNLAIVLDRQTKYAEAEPLYQKALAIEVRVYGSNHPKVANTLTNMSSLYLSLNKFDLCEKAC